MDHSELGAPVEAAPEEEARHEPAHPHAASPSPADVAPAGAKAFASRNWVPVRSLGPRHRERILAHLISLDERSRYLRFGFAALDSHIVRYIDNLDFQHDEVFGIFNRRLDLIAMAHLAYQGAGVARGHVDAAEFGVSVLPKARKRGFGRRLFEHAMLHSRNRGVQTIFIHALSENTAMLKLAKGAGAVIERNGSESEAWLTLPAETFASHMDQILGDGAAEFDYRLKLHAQQVENLFKRSQQAPGGDG